MGLARVGVLGVVLAAAACDPTGRTTTGISQGGAQTVRVLAFTVPPSAAAAGEIISPTIQVEVRDTLGNVDETFAPTVSVALSANPTGAFLDGTKAALAVFGVASFADLRVNRAGTGYTLVATAPGARAATSTAFNITSP